MTTKRVFCAASVFMEGNHVYLASSRRKTFKTFPEENKILWWEQIWFCWWISQRANVKINFGYIVGHIWAHKIQRLILNILRLTQFFPSGRERGLYWQLNLTLLILNCDLIQAAKWSRAIPLWKNSRYPIAQHVNGELSEMKLGFPVLKEDAGHQVFPSITRQWTDSLHFFHVSQPEERREL
jgi:hypothetical protein